MKCFNFIFFVLFSLAALASPHLLAIAMEQNDAAPDNRNGRNYDAEPGGANRFGNRAGSPPPPGPEPNAPPNDNPVTHMLQGLANFVLSDIPDPEQNTFVPNFTFFSYVLQQMEEMMWNSPAVRGLATYWTPYHTMLFYTTLLVIHCLLVQYEAKSLPRRYNSLVRDIRASISLDTIMIPGPLVMFFQAITVCETEDPMRPISPNVTRAFPTPDNLHGALDTNFVTLLPALISLRRTIRWLADNVDATNFLSASQQTRHHFNSAVNNEAIPPGTGTRCALRANFSPGIMFTLTMSRASVQAYRQGRDRFRIPTVVADCGSQSLEEYLGFSGSMDWFQAMTVSANKYCLHWKGAMSYGDISLRNGEAMKLVAHYRDAIPARNAGQPADVDVEPLLPPNLVELISLERTVSPSAVTLALGTQLNTVVPPNYGLSDNAGQVGVTREGPYWTSSREKLHVGPLSTVGAIIDKLPTLFIERPINKKQT